MKAAVEPFRSALTPEEQARNVKGDDRLYIREGHRGYGLLRSLYVEDFDKSTQIEMDGQLFEGMRGKVLLSDDCVETDG